MAFLRVEKKKSGTYLRIVEGFRQNGKIKHKTLYSLGKVEDYPPEQLQRIATKILQLAGGRVEDILKDDLKELRRVNYGYALVIKHLWKKLNLDEWMRKINYKRHIHFDWLSTLELMIAERLNEPCSKLSNFNHQQEYIGFGDKPIELHHFYRTLDVLEKEQESLKKHLFTTQQNLFSTELDIVFYDVTTLYFDSDEVKEGSIRQKGYSKDGKAHKIQVVLGLLIDKFRNPITYHVYQGNTYEGSTMIKALEDLKSKFHINKGIVVADSGMIDKSNREYIEQQEGLDYILGDSIKVLPKEISSFLIDKKNHHALYLGGENFSYATTMYNGRRIICTYSEKRAEKDRREREKLIEKAKKLLQNSSVLKQIKKRGAGRYIKQTSEENYNLDKEKIKADEKWDGFKALATTTDLPVVEVIEKYADLFEVEHAFRTLKSQLEIRPMYHWTDKRIKGHIAMCFIAYSMLNYLRLVTGLQPKDIIRALDHMQLSEIQEGEKQETFYLRSSISFEQRKLIDTLKLVVPKDTTPQRLIHQYFK